MPEQFFVTAMRLHRTNIDALDETRIRVRKQTGRSIDRSSMLRGVLNAVMGKVNFAGCVTEESVMERVKAALNGAGQSKQPAGRVRNRRSK